MTRPFTDPSGLIDTTAFPYQAQDLDVEWLQEQARWCRTIGATIEETTRTLHGRWSGLRNHYDAPEAPALYQAMDPVQDRGRHESNVWFIAAGKIDTYSDELGPLRQKLKLLTSEVEAFRNQVAGGILVTADDVDRHRVTLEPAELAGWYDGARTSDTVNWTQHIPTVEKNEALLAEARQLFDQIETARAALEQQLQALRDDGAAEGQVGTNGAVQHNLGHADPHHGTHTIDISWFTPEPGWLDGDNPDAVRDWWDHLTPWQHAALITTIPLVIGNLNGIPLGTRAQANEINIRNEIARLQAELDAMPHDPQHDWKEPPEGFNDPWQSKREKVQQAIDNYKKYLELPEPRDLYGYIDGEYAKVGETTAAQVIAFDPAASSIATYNGPLDADGDIPDWVKNIVIHVPGTTSKMRTFNGTDDLGYDIYTAASETDGADPTASITWGGGPFPQHLDAAWDAYSRYLGPRLSDFAAGIDRAADSTMTVTGHSYGAAVVGRAEADGLEADRVLYVAGAGLGNDNETIAGFPRTGDEPHYSMIARNDGITGGIQDKEAGNLGHGSSAQGDPSNVQLETGFQNAGDQSSGTIEDLGPVGAHSGVYDRGSTAFQNIIGVITGTDAELFAPDRAQVTRQVTAGDYWEIVDGIKHPDYMPDNVDISDLEEGRTAP